jgi:hypothetical protein
MRKSKSSARPNPAFREGDPCEIDALGETLDIVGNLGSPRSVGKRGGRRPEVFKVLAGSSMPGSRAIARHRNRWRPGLAEGEPKYDELKKWLAACGGKFPGNYAAATLGKIKSVCRTATAVHWRSVKQFTSAIRTVLDNAVSRPEGAGHRCGEGDVAVEHEVVIEFNRMLTEHTAGLWKIASGLVVLEVLIIAHILVSTRLPFRRSAVAWVLSISTIANVASMAFGYLANGTALAAFQKYARGGDWQPDFYAELFNLLQMAALTLGLLVFLFAFVFYSRILAQNLIEAGAHVGGGGHDE